MTAQETRLKFLEFFKERGHKIVPSSSLISDDPSVLLTTAGMQQFKKYYTREADALNDFGVKNTASVQKSFRTSDIGEVGDESHLTFFEMLGNFSFGGYFKKEAIGYAVDFLKELKIPIDFVTIFAGDDMVPPDEESEEIWRQFGITRIEKRGREDNFWGPTGKEGPCGPTTEIYVSGIEIWNIVFNQYYCKPNKILVPLEQNGVDTGMGLERLLMIVEGVKNIFETDLFARHIELLPSGFAGTEKQEERIKRVMVDHLRGSAFLIADGVRPSNKEAGYVLRRLIRRTLVYKEVYGIADHVYDAVLHDIAHDYGVFYPELTKSGAAIREEFRKEREKFGKALIRGTRELESMKEPVTAEAAFRIYETYGLPFEIIREFGGDRASSLTREAFDVELKKHQEISRAGQERKFGGHGLLLDTGELKAADEAELKKVTRLHTATHLLNAALHMVLGDTVQQAGSDITAERTRFDFTFPRKLTAEELEKIEHLVNYAVDKNLPVTAQEMNVEDAKKSGALFFSRGNYPPMVKVYTVGNRAEIFSKELCGGPHVQKTGEIGKFRIVKEEASSAGVRRIRGVID